MRSETMRVTFALGVEGSISLEVLGVWSTTEFAVLLLREKVGDFFLGPRIMGYENPRTRRATMGNGEVAMYARKAEEFIEFLRW